MTHAWAVVMRAFPGSFPPCVFDSLSLDRLADIHGLAVEILEAEAAAARAAAEAGGGRR